MRAENNVTRHGLADRYTRNPKIGGSLLPANENTVRSDHFWLGSGRKKVKLVNPNDWRYSTNDRLAFPIRYNHSSSTRRRKIRNSTLTSWPSIAIRQYDKVEDAEFALNVLLTCTKSYRKNCRSNENRILVGITARDFTAKRVREETRPRANLLNPIKCRAILVFRVFEYISLNRYSVYFFAGPIKFDKKKKGKKEIFVTGERNRVLSRIIASATV